MNFRLKHFWTFVLAASLLAAGCGDTGGGEQNNGANNGDDDLNNTPTLVDRDVLLEGAPDNETLPGERKSDVTYPATFDDLVELQSSVKSQGSRGVCSIFSTVGLMEHLYIKEGTYQNPDFSEQYLQWSVKTRSAPSRIRAARRDARTSRPVNRFGIPGRSGVALRPVPVG